MPPAVRVPAKVQGIPAANDRRRFPDAVPVASGYGGVRRLSRLAERQVDPQRQKRVIVRELLIALAVLVLFLFAGRLLLQIFHISEPSLSISGGVILFLIALRMIFPSREGAYADYVDAEPFIVPLAVPYAPPGWRQRSFSTAAPASAESSAAAA